MYTQSQTNTPWPVFYHMPRLVKSNKSEISAAVETEAVDESAISISEKDYEQIAKYINNHCEEVDDNYFTCSLDAVDFDLACGGTLEITGDISIATDYSDDEFMATGYTGRVIKTFVSIDCSAYNDNGDVVPSDFDQKLLETHIQ